MIDYSKQIDQIKKKLIQAKKADKEYRVFGAAGHKYKVNPPASLEVVIAFEEKYIVRLPECYRNFILQIGNGGAGYLNSSAGPFFGIYPFGEHVDQLIYGDFERYLKEKCCLHPNLTDMEWDNMNKVLEEEDISDHNYYNELAKIYSGILPIGSQGCTFLHGIVLTGPHKGKVINLDMNYGKPRFTFEKNFLDWYERWLDEVISGQLIKLSATWFGYTPSSKN